MGETICAISTAFGEGGIGIVRISGEEAKSILFRIFAHEGEIEPRKLCYGHIKNPETGEVIDEALAVFMPAPHTYTTEDVVEIDCHGSIVSLRRTLALCQAEGARMAEKGEFTKRAFLGGRLDLSQAEAVIDLIKAKTGGGYDIAMSQLEGTLSREVKKLRADLLDILVDMTVNIDYPDEDIEEIVTERLINALAEIRDRVLKLYAGSETGRIMKEGLDVAIVGKPNVGKSSLMNALLRESRAIVTKIPGTTRDTIEEFANIKDIPVKLTDTAGIRTTEDEIEKIGIERSKDSLAHADLVCFIVDASMPLAREDEEIIEAVKGHKTVVLLNKQDLKEEIKSREKEFKEAGAAAEKDIKMTVSIEEMQSRLPEAHVIETSIAKGTGVDAFENFISDEVMSGGLVQEESAIVSSARHENLLRECAESMREAIEAAQEGEPLELIETDTRDAYEKLGEIIGEEVSGDIIDEVFSRFCLGK